MLIPITVNSIMKAKELAAAMEMRGFRAYPERTSYMVLKMRAFDYILTGLSLGVALLFIFMRGAI
jgi:energy-coupling factor transport system permease protein